jgi:hypothetical protein
MKISTGIIEACVTMFFCLFLFNCSDTEGFLHLPSSTEHFIPLEDDPRVFYEEGSKESALEVAEVLPVLPDVN